MYTRRHQTEEKHAREEEIIPSGHDHEAQGQADPHDSASHPSASHDGTSSSYDDLDVPIALRKKTRTAVGKLPSKLSQYIVSNHVSYSLVGSKYRSFIAALDSTVPIPRDVARGEERSEVESSNVGRNAST